MIYYIQDWDAYGYDGVMEEGRGPVPRGVGGRAGRARGHQAREPGVRHRRGAEVLDTFPMGLIPQ